VKDVALEQDPFSALQFEQVFDDPSFVFLPSEWFEVMVVTNGDVSWHGAVQGQWRVGTAKHNVL
jgi:hypothetical protein